MSRVGAWFNRDEFACKCGCGFDTVDAELVHILDDLRNWADAPVTINSACRCPSHNKSVGGSKNSYHMKARAADVVVAGKTPQEVQAWFNQYYPGKYGLGTYGWGNHIDTRTGHPWRG